MSQVQEKTAQKRKHTMAETAPDAEPSTKRAKKDGKVKKDKTRKEQKGKGLGKAGETGEFRVAQASLAVSVPPMFANNLREGVEEMLDSMLMRCVTSHLCTGRAKVM